LPPTFPNFNENETHESKGGGVPRAGKEQLLVNAWFHMIGKNPCLTCVTVCIAWKSSSICELLTCSCFKRELQHGLRSDLTEHQTPSRRKRSSPPIFMTLRSVTNHFRYVWGVIDTLIKRVRVEIFDDLLSSSKMSSQILERVNHCWDILECCPSLRYGNSGTATTFSFVVQWQRPYHRTEI